MQDAKIVLSAEDRASRAITGLRRELEGLRGQAERVNSVLGLFGGGFLTSLAGAGAIGGVKALVGQLDDLSEAAQGLQVGAVALAEYRAAAREAGAGAEVLDKGLAKLNVKIGEAASGNEQAAALFRGLGIAVRDSAGNVRSTEAIFEDFAAAWVKLQDGPDKATLGNEFFGKSITKLTPLLNQGGEGLRRYTGLTQESVREAERLAAEFDRMSLGAERFKNKLIGGLLPALNDIMEAGSRVPPPESVLGRLLGGLTGVAGIAARPEFVRALAEIRQQRALFGNVESGVSSTARGSAADVLAEAAKAAKERGATAKAERDSIDDNARAYARFVEELDRATRAGEELTRLQEVQRAVEQGRFGVLIPQQQELLLLLAAEADARTRAMAQAKELAAVEAQLEADRQRAFKTVEDLAGITEDNRKRDLTAAAESWIAYKRAIGDPATPEQLDRLAKGLGGIKDELEKTSDAAEQFALVMTSALSDFFKNPRDKNIFKALEADILQLISQMLVLQPLAEALKGTFKSGDLAGSFGSAFSNAGGGLEKLFGGFSKLFAGFFADGGYIRPGQWGIVGERGPEPAFGGRTGLTVTPAGRGAGMTVINNITLPPGSPRESADQIAAEVSRRLARANSRYN